MSKGGKMRLVSTQEKAQLFYKNRYDKTTHIITLEANTSSYVPTFEKRYKCLLNNIEPLFIYEGRGVLPIAEAKKAYDFKRLKFEYLDYFLQNGRFHSRISHSQRALIEQWVEVAENNHNLSYSICPPFFEEVAEKILYGEEEAFASYKRQEILGNIF